MTVSCLLFLGACGGDDGGESGLPPSALLQSLGPDEFAAACAEFAAYSDRFEASPDAQQGFCVAVGAAGVIDQPPSDPSKLVTVCQEGVALCQDELSMPNSVDTAISMLMGDICVGAPPAQCPVTVGDVHNCLDLGIELLAQAGRSSTCETLRADGTLSGESTPILPQSCERIAEAGCE